MRAITLIDAEYLRKEAQKVIGYEHTSLEAQELTHWLRQEDHYHPVRWYDAHHKFNHPQASDRRMFFNHMAFKASIKLRMGTLVERNDNRINHALNDAMPAIAKELGIPVERLRQAFGNHWVSQTRSQQKGVDALLILDMVELAQSGRFDSIQLCAGDMDFLPVINKVQQMGIFVSLIVPRPLNTARPLWADTDCIIEIPKDVLIRTFPEKV